MARAGPFEPDPGHAGEGTGSAAEGQAYSISSRPDLLKKHRRCSNDAPDQARRSMPLTSPSTASNVPETVTTGPIVGSRKVYAAPAAHPSMRVPFREIALSDPKEPAVRVYDPSGPYTESGAPIDLRAGLPAVRESWIAARNFDALSGRAVRPEDNGNVSADRLVAACPAAPGAARRPPGQLVTQYEFARAGDRHRRDDLCRASRESRARGAPSRMPPSGWPMAKASAPPCPSSSRRNSCATRWRAAERSSPPTSTISNSSRWRSGATSWSRSTPISAIRP